MKSLRGGFRILRREQLLQELVHDTYKISSGVRRLPVVTADGSLFGIVTLDDVPRVLSGEIGALALALGRGRTQEAGARRRLETP